MNHGWQIELSDKCVGSEVEAVCASHLLTDLSANFTLASDGTWEYTVVVEPQALPI